MTLMRRVMILTALLGLLTAPAWAGQRHYGLRDCRYRWLPLVYAPYGFTETRPTSKPSDNELFSFRLDKDGGLVFVTGRLFAAGPVNASNLEAVMTADLSVFQAGDAGVILEALEPRELPRGRRAVMRRVISPASGNWALIAYVAMPGEIFRIKLEASTQAAYNLGEEGFQDVLDKLFIAIADGPRYGVSACELLGR